MENFRKRKSEIWAIAGGKGGTGKSFVASSVGNYLASCGKKVVLIDADLGSENLHTFLGMRSPKISLANFFENKLPLTDLIIESRIPNLRLATGVHQPFAMASVKHTQKLKFFRHIKNLYTDYTIIDLGGGTHVNIIDTFLLADKMIVVINPEITSIENMYKFIKCAILRRLNNLLSDNGYTNIKNTLKNRELYGIRNIKDLIDFLKGSSNKTVDILNNGLHNLKVYIILNKTKTSEDIMIGNSVKSVLIKYFSIGAEYIGYIEYDDCVHRCVNERQPLWQAFPSSRCARGIVKISDNLLNRTPLSGIRFKL